MENAIKLTTIGVYSFGSTTSLTSITIPSSVTSFSNYTFYSSGIKSITIPENSKLTAIAYASLQLSKIESIVIPLYVTNLRPYCFNSCTSLDTVTYLNPEIISIVDSSVFGNDTNIKTVNFYLTPSAPNAPTITEGTVYDTSLYPSGSSFYYFADAYIITTFTYSDDTESTSYDTTLTKDSYDSTKTLTSVVIGNGVTSIADACFKDCTSLASVNMDDASILQTIGDYSFSGCTSLTSITIPSSVTSLGDYAFAECRNLESVIYNGPNNLDSNSSVGSTPFLNDTSINQVYFYNTDYTAETSPDTGVFNTTLYPSGTSYAYSPYCYNEGTLVQCVDKYVKIEDLRKGDLVKTYLHGFKPIEFIGKNKTINSQHDNLYSMYKINDLIVTGGHFILVDDLSGNKLQNVHSNSHSQFYNLNLKIDDKYCLLACDYVNAERIIDNKVYNIYHLALEGENERYGIYVNNGVLSESTSKEHFLKHHFTLLNDN